MNTTNISPNELNYHSYSNQKYDHDIVNAIPFHKEIHEKIIRYLKEETDPQKDSSILDLGVGTGITSKAIQMTLPQAEFDVIDFSETMLQGARKRLGINRVNYILGDYAEYVLNKNYDFIISVIGIHHQNHNGKKLLFKKIFNHLYPGGVFIFADLVTYKDNRKAALCHARHYHHLVEKAINEKTLEDWAYHHMFLNQLAPLEDQILWLQNIGFNVDTLFARINTALLICQKPYETTISKNFRN